jgi:hypothetical protein
MVVDLVPLGFVLAVVWLCCVHVLVVVVRDLEPTCASVQFMFAALLPKSSDLRETHLVRLLVDSKLDKGYSRLRNKLLASTRNRSRCSSRRCSSRRRFDPKRTLN